jgi:cyclopropane fatty-acyl-phospholipid synthase-like methyltransferase
MASGFNVHAAAGYEQLMGRRSRKLAPLFIDFAGVADGEKILDVGCGTGSLTFALATAAELGESQRRETRRRASPDVVRANAWGAFRHVSVTS